MLHSTFVLVLSLLSTILATEVVLKPIKDGPTEKIVIFIIGAGVSPEHYSGVMAELQKQSPTKLWVGIPEFLGEFPNPLTIGLRISGMLSTIQKAGFTGATKADVIIGAHSLGGIFAPKAVTNGGYSGLMEFASYITKDSSDPTKNTLAAYPVPVLTLAGEMDGLTRPSRIAIELQHYHEIASDKGDDYAASNKPVVLIEDINHSDFCNDFNVTDDIIPSDVSQDVAHQRIAEVAAAFLELVFHGPTKAHDSLTLMKQKIAATDTFFAPYLKLTAMDENDACQSGQHVLAPLAAKDASRLTVSAQYVSDKKTFQATDCVINPTTGTATGTSKESTISRPFYEANAIDRSTTPTAPIYVQCKLKSAEAVAQSLATTPTGNVTCMDLNQYNLQLALDTLSKTTTARYAARGKQLTFLADRVDSTEAKYYADALSLAASSSDPQTWTVTSPAFVSSVSNDASQAGAHFCSFMSPSRMAEWIMTDALKEKPGV